MAAPVNRSTSISMFVFRSLIQVMGNEIFAATNGFPHMRQSAWMFANVRTDRIGHAIRDSPRQPVPVLNMQLIVIKLVSFPSFAHDFVHGRQVEGTLTHMIASAQQFKNRCESTVVFVYGFSSENG